MLFSTVRATAGIAIWTAYRVIKQYRLIWMNYIIDSVVLVWDRGDEYIIMAVWVVVSSSQQVLRI